MSGIVYCPKCRKQVEGAEADALDIWETMCPHCGAEFVPKYERAPLDEFDHVTQFNSASPPKNSANSTQANAFEDSVNEFDDDTALESEGRPVLPTNQAKPSNKHSARQPEQNIPPIPKSGKNPNSSKLRSIVWISICVFAFCVVGLNVIVFLNRSPAPKGRQLNGEKGPRIAAEHPTKPVQDEPNKEKEEPSTAANGTFKPPTSVMQPATSHVTRVTIDKHPKGYQPASIESISLSLPDAPPSPPEPEKPSPHDERSNAGPGKVSAIDFGSIQVDPPTEPTPDVPGNLDLFFVKVPLLASGNGPFVIDTHSRIAAMTGRGEAAQEASQPQILYDLRSGRKAGEFHWRAPNWKGGILSPNGRYIIGPDTEGSMTGTVNDGKLYIWKQGAKESQSMQLTEWLYWMDFLPTGDLVTLTLKESPARITIWDVSRGKELRRFDLERSDFPSDWVKEPTPILGKYHYLPYRLNAAISPSGRYLALGGPKSILMVNLTDGSIAGRLTYPENVLNESIPRSGYRGISFTPDGEKLFAVMDVALCGWSLKDGTRYVREVKDALGVILPSPLPNSWIHSLSRYQHYISPGVCRIDGPTNFKPGGVLHDYLAAPLCKLDFTPLRWLGPGRYLGHVSAGVDDKRYKATMKPRIEGQDRPPQVLKVIQYDAAALRSDASELINFVDSREELTAFDRAAVINVAPIPPETWKVPAPSEPPSTPLALALPDWQDFNSRELAVITIGPSKKDPKINPPTMSFWNRVSVATGDLIGAPVPLWSIRAISRRQERPTVDRPVAAVSDEEQPRLACRDPNDDKRIDIWDQAGGWHGGFVPYDDETTVEAIYWGARGRLLTVSKGRVAGWDVDQKRGLFTISGNYHGPLQFEPGRSWFIATHGDQIDVFDTASGACLGRLRAEGVSGGWFNSGLLSPDGEYVLRIRNGNPLDPAKPEHNVRIAAIVWNLKHGKPIGVYEYGSQESRFKPVAWHGSKQFLGGSNNAYDLIDVLGGLIVGQYKTPHHFEGIKGSPEGDIPIRPGPGGRTWIAVTNESRPNVATAKNYRRLVVPGSRIERKDESVDLGYWKGARVRVEVDLGNIDRSERTATKVAKALLDQHRQIAPGGWTVRIEHRTFESDVKMMTQQDPGDSTVLPGEEMIYSIVDPGGNVAWTHSEKLRFDSGLSKYRINGKGKSEHAPAIIATDFNFPGPVVELVSDEILDQVSNEITAIFATFPIALAPSGTVYPIKADFAVAIKK